MVAHALRDARNYQSVRRLPVLPGAYALMGELPSEPSACESSGLSSLIAPRSGCQFNRCPKLRVSSFEFRISRITSVGINLHFMTSRDRRLRGRQPRFRVIGKRYRGKARPIPPAHARRIGRGNRHARIELYPKGVCYELVERDFRRRR